MKPTPPPLEVVPVQFAESTGNVHLDQAIEFAAEMAMGKVKRMLVAEMTSALKEAIEMDSKFPRPPRGAILNRGTAIDKVCQCGRVVTFPIHEAKPTAP